MNDAVSIAIGARKLLSRFCCCCCGKEQDYEDSMDCLCSRVNRSIIGVVIVKGTKSGNRQSQMTQNELERKEADTSPTVLIVRVVPYWLPVAR